MIIFSALGNFIFLILPIEFFEILENHQTSHVTVRECFSGVRTAIFWFNKYIFISSGLGFAVQKKQKQTNFRVFCLFVCLWVLLFFVFLVFCLFVCFGSFVCFALKYTPIMGPTVITDLNQKTTKNNNKTVQLL